MRWRHKNEEPQDKTDDFLQSVESAMGLMDDLKRNAAALNRAAARAQLATGQLNAASARAERLIAELRQLRSQK
jgi:ABC-type transporter Mla subunit MlaD